MHSYLDHNRRYATSVVATASFRRPVLLKDPTKSATVSVATQQCITICRADPRSPYSCPSIINPLRGFRAPSTRRYASPDLYTLTATVTVTKRHALRQRSATGVPPQGFRCTENLCKKLHIHVIVRKRQYLSFTIRICNMNTRAHSDIMTLLSNTYYVLSSYACTFMRQVLLC
jgi:hypothetical protein